MFARHITAAAQAHGAAEYPCEAIGLVVDNAYVPLVNIAARPERECEVDPQAWLTYGSSIEAVIHSHPDDWPVPSERDMRQQIATAVPWGIYSTQKATSSTAPEPVTYSPVVWFGRQVPRAPLIARPGQAPRGFHHGHTDCLSGIEDWHEIQGVTLPQSPRDWEWWLKRAGPDGEPIAPKDFYRDLYEPYGFEIVEPMIPGSVFMGALGTNADGTPCTTPNHAGVYLGNNLMLHHLTAQKAIDPARLCCRQPIGRWLGHFNTTPIWVRHKKLPLKGLKEV